MSNNSKKKKIRRKQIRMRMKKKLSKKIPTEKIRMLQEIKQKTEFLRSLFRTVLLAVLILMNFACGGNPSLQKRSNANASPEVKLTAIERDIKSLQTANFQYIFVF